MSQVLATITFEVTEELVQKILNQINEYRYEEEDEPQITIEQVKSNPKLLAYIVDEYKRGADFDIFEMWNSDVWAEIDSYL